VPVPGGHDAIYAGRHYAKLRELVRACIAHHRLVIGLTVAALFVAGLGFGLVKKQFFPSSDRSELILEVYMPPGTAFKATEAVVAKVEKALLEEPSADRERLRQRPGRWFFLSLNPASRRRVRG
jgi:multidrug efflux pump subunit AcrB